MNWLYYLLEANLYLVVFYGFYRLFLQNETFYSLNRYFLLLSTVISFALPVLQLGFLKLPIKKDIVSIEPISPVNEITEINWVNVVYLLVALGFVFKLCFSIYKIVKIWVKAEKHSAGAITLIKVNGESTAFSFFNLLFIHPSLANQPAVLKHEMIHIKQKHSFDVLFFELLQIICWFNPIIHFIKKDVKLLHEYIADDLTTNEDVQKHEYALFLIQNSFGLRAQSITNQIFNQSILKRRINMLNKKRTGGWARLRLLLALPLTGAMLCTSTMAFTKNYGYVDLLPEKSESTVPIQDTLKMKSVKKSIPQVKNTKKQDQIKFPPPIVRPNKPSKGSKTPPPPLEPPPPPKADQVKFPPPIVKPDKPSKGVKTPPPPVEPPPPRKKDVVKFPPPIVKPDNPSKHAKTHTQPVEPPPPRQKVINATVPPPPVEPPPSRPKAKTVPEDPN